ncbi:MAG: CPBP family intramembrane glutamic endopeptidase [Caulobacteraceae bacterium]
MQLIILRWVFPSGVLSDVARATGGVAQPTLLANAAISIVVIGGALIGVGGQRLRDLGLTGGVRLAAFATAIVWGLLNLAEAADAWRSGDLAVDPAWAIKPVATIGQWIAVTFGTAFLEEIVFRGVLLRQLFSRARSRRIDPAVALLAAIMVSQSLFAAMHLPMLLTIGATGLWRPLLGLFVAGCALAVLFVVTGNLPLCIGIHGLADAPSLLVVDRWGLLDHQSFVLCACLMLAAIHTLGERWKGRGLTK